MQLLPEQNKKKYSYQPLIISRPPYSSPYSIFESTATSFAQDFRYENGEYVYHDAYVGGEQFAGEEAIWKNGIAVYAMNYMGRVLEDKFSGNFLKEALRCADAKMPYRGPEYYRSGGIYLQMQSVRGCELVSGIRGDIFK